MLNLQLQAWLSVPHSGGTQETYGDGALEDILQNLHQRQTYLHQRAKDLQCEVSKESYSVRRSR